MSAETRVYSFFNNKGGVGKTTLCQNVACLYAENNPTKQVLVIDLCPQANISQFLMGGGHVGYEKNQKLQAHSTLKNIVGFIDWLLKGNSGFSTIKTSYKVCVAEHNEQIADNLYLIAGDSFLESFSLALNYAVLNPANKHAWKEYMTAIHRLCECEFDSHEYDSLTVFIDCNPSFSIYTQMALVSSDFLVTPMMADFSSLEGVKATLMLLYGKYPSAALKKYADDIVTFNAKIEESGLPLPKFWEFIFNNFTPHAGVAKAFDAVRNELVEFCYTQFQTSPELFAAYNGAIDSQVAWESVFVSKTKDFHTAGKVSSSLGIPLHKLPQQNKYDMPNGEPVNLPEGNYKECLQHIHALVNKIT